MPNLNNISIIPVVRPLIAASGLTAQSCIIIVNFKAAERGQKPPLTHNFTSKAPGDQELKIGR